MLQMKESFHSRVVWVQIKRVGSSSEHNYLFSSVIFGQVRFSIESLLELSASLYFFKGLFRNNYSMFQ